VGLTFGVARKSLRTRYRTDGHQAGSVAVVRIGDHEVSRDKALVILRRYAERHAGTVLLYDLAGDRNGHPGPGGASEPVNEVTLADIGRLVVINAGLRADDVPLLLDVHAGAEFQAVPATARLQDCAPGSDLLEAATRLYGRFRRLPGVGAVKRSKLLHIKRPWLITIYDTHVHCVYARSRDATGGWWEAARRDLVDNSDDFAWLSARLRDDDDARVRRAGKLTELRLLDVIAWDLGGEKG
jgi:hypothetical protein